MHCVLLGVFPALLNRQLKLLTISQKQSLEGLIRSTFLPFEMTVHGRKPRLVSERANFKANEYFQYLFFLSPIFFRSFFHVDSLQYINLLKLSFGIRILLESNRENDVNVADGLLKSFCDNAVKIFGTKKCETINLHSLRHLPDQVRRFGPLFVQSAMSFESAHAFLAKFASGSHDFCEIIARRYLERHLLLTDPIANDDLTELTGNWTGQSLTSFINAEKESYVNLTPLIELAIANYPGAKIQSHCKIEGVVYDSISYSRNIMGPNSYVRYLSNGSYRYGQIQYFITFAEEPNIKYAFVARLNLDAKYLSVDPCLQMSYFMKVERSVQCEKVPTRSFHKMACIENQTETWLASVPPFLDHK